MKPHYRCDVETILNSLYQAFIDALTLNIPAQPADMVSIMAMGLSGALLYYWGEETHSGLNPAH
jgi:hypothetical protein